MSAGHAPGKWAYSFESVDPEWAVVTTSDGTVIANVNAHGRQEENARLIAAAPELLEALQFIREHGEEFSELAAKKAIAAINKATGATP